MNIVVSVSLRSDEEAKVREKMEELKLNRHQVLKLAIRRFLFPDEAEIPVGDGKATVVHKTEFELYHLKDEPKIDVRE